MIRFMHYRNNYDYNVAFLNKEVYMNQKELNRLDCLTLDLNMNLNVLYSAIMCFNDELEVCDLINIVKNLYGTSVKVRELFNNSN